MHRPGRGLSRGLSHSLGIHGPQRVCEGPAAEHHHLAAHLERALVFAPLALATISATACSRAGQRRAVDAAHARDAPASVAARTFITAASIGGVAACVAVQEAHDLDVVECASPVVRGRKGEAEPGAAVVVAALVEHEAALHAIGQLRELAQRPRLAANKTSGES